MSPADIAVTILGVLLVSLFSVIAFLLKGRFDEQDRTLRRMNDTLNSHSVLLAALTEAQRAVTANQLAQTRSQDRLLSEAEELEDATDQLHDATRMLREHVFRHESFLKTLGYTKDA